MSKFRRPLFIVLAVSVLDLVGRFAFDFEMKRVVLLEAVLFLLAALFLVWAARRDQTISRTARRIDVWLAILFGLGSLRAGLWSVGLPVTLANLIVFAVSVIAAIGYSLRRRAFRAKRNDGHLV